MAYATLADLATYTGRETVSPGDERLLQRASDLLDAVLANSFYTVDQNGVATSTVVQTALTEAACAQVEWWRITGDEFGAQGQFRPAPGSTTLKSGLPVVAGTGFRRLAPRAREALQVLGIYRHKALAW